MYRQRRFSFMPALPPAPSPGRENPRSLRSRRWKVGASGSGSRLNVVQMLKRRSRPERGDIDEAALRLLSRHGAQILGTARRYAMTPEDAEDAYQRALEILLTKAPTTREEELIPWLKTVVKHEAFALRRQRERHSPVTDDGELGDRPTPPAITHDQAERLEQLRQGAEALAELKPHEVQALLLRAEGYSYREICERTGWTYTKVNRLLTEGRRAFLRRVSGIQGGAECVRFEPMLSALADGEASAEDLALLRPHMRTCLSCRARLREFRAAPDRVAALVPPLALAAADAAPGGGGAARGLLESTLQSVLGGAQHKAGALGERLHAAAELATGQKLAAAAVSAAALAGGGATVDQFGGERAPQPPAIEQRADTKPIKEESTVEVEPAPVVEQPPATPAPPAEQPAPSPEPAPAQPPPPPPDPANEFAPGGAGPATTLEAAQPAPPTQTSSGLAPAAGGGGSAGGGGAGGEFAP